jgi:predicted DCC family thiol-disulfide oxidoreductase YuxK
MRIAPLIVLIDGGCPMCRRTARLLRAVDWLGRLTFADGTNAALRNQWAPGLPEEAVLREMNVVSPSGARAGGYEGFLQIATVVPLLWPAGLLGRIPGIRHLGRAAYRWIAARRLRDGRCTDDLCAPGHLSLPRNQR